MLHDNSDIYKWVIMDGIRHTFKKNDIAILGLDRVLFT